jgi:hypothetical protein
VTDDPSALPELRASDTEREQTAEALRQAAGEGRLTVDELDERLHQAFAARTRSELQTLVADLLPPDPRVPVRGGEGGTRWLLSILGGIDRRGHWRLAERAININFWGGSTIDLNDAELTARDTTLHVITIMGGADIRVPDGLNVDVSELAIMGGNDVRLGEPLPDPGGPTLHIKMFTLMGGSDVKRGRRRTRAQRRALAEGGRDQH